jgi:hypothetical protein
VQFCVCKLDDAAVLVEPTRLRQASKPTLSADPFATDPTTCAAAGSVQAARDRVGTLCAVALQREAYTCDLVGSENVAPCSKKGASGV